MKRTIIYLVSAFVVFFGTLYITNLHMTEESIREADRINDLQVQYVGRRMDAKLSLREKSVLCFLSALLNYNISYKGGVLDTVAYIPDDMVARFPHYVYMSLDEFMKLNPMILMACFAVDPSVYPHINPNGFAPCVKGHDPTRYNLADIYDYMHSDTYRILRKNGDCLWRIPHVGSPVRGKTVTYYVPIRRESGSFFGYFAINVNLNLLRNDIIESLPYGKNNSAVIISNENGEIIFSTSSFYNSFDKLSEIDYAISHDHNIKKEKSKHAHHDIYEWNGSRYYVYHTKMQKAPWHVVTICKEDAIYEEVNKTRNAILVVALIGIIIMFGCCLVVFRQMRNNLRQKAAVEDELNMAAKVQMSMLRGQRFENGQASLQAFIQPAHEAGGDLYDYVEKDGKLMFCIGDVSGKGMPAAIFMAQVVSLFRNAVLFVDSPEEIVSQMNAVLTQNNPDMTFCTFIVGVLDGNTLTYCNAGHNPPLILNPQPSFLHPHSNIALGLMDGFPFKQDTLTLNPSDHILFYTDGVTEAKDKAHKQYGENRLLEVLTNSSHADDLCASVLQSVRSFVGNAPQSDDITIVSITCCS